MKNANIWLEPQDIDIMVEINRNGLASLTFLAFATGNFSGDIESRVRNLINIGMVSILTTRPLVNYCVTGEGLEALYLADAFWKAANTAMKLRLVNFRIFRLRQRHVLKNPSAPELIANAPDNSVND